PWRARHAAWAFDPHIDRQADCLVVHELDTRKTEHIGDLVGIDEHGGRAMRNDRARKLGHCYHAAFDVHVSVAQTWDEIAIRRIYRPSLAIDRVGGIRPHIRNAAAGDRHI